MDRRDPQGLRKLVGFLTGWYSISSRSQYLCKMVQNEISRSRGRPRNYDPDVALARATDAFWSTGFSGTSLDRLCEATEMNRPSLYLAFGDKRALYLAALGRYIEQSSQAIAAALDYEVPLAVALTQLYELTLTVYLPKAANTRGCFMISTAVPEALDDDEIRSLLRAAVAEFDRLVCARLLHARKIGELPEASDPLTMASIATAVVHTLAIRARAGESRKALMAIVAAAVKMICGPPAPVAGTRRRSAAR